jgi:hypothetical protein
MNRRSSAAVLAAAHSLISHAAAQTPLDFFVTDPSLWKLAPAELEARLAPLGYKAATPADGSATLGDPRDLMKRKAQLAPGLPVWNVKLAPSTTLRRATISLLPPATVGTPPTKSEFRATSKAAADFIQKSLRSQPKPWIIDYANPGRKTECLRWTSDSLQVVLTSSSLDSGTFTPERLDLKIMPSAAPGTPPNAKPAAPTPDRTTGTIRLSGIPGFNPWPGHPPDWAVVEQALWALGKSSDRNAILEYSDLGPSWPGSFCPAISHVTRASLAKPIVLVPEIHAAPEAAKLATACQAAAKKIGQPAPQTVQNLLDIHPEVLRLARASQPQTALLSAAIRKALDAGQPILWLGWRGLYQETPETPEKPTPAIRLISGLDPRNGRVLFTATTGQPDGDMATSDALAASFQIIALSK